MRKATLYHGHVLDALAGLPERSVQCCVTSPPYFGLRDYKLPPQIWDGAPGCEHEWGEAIAGRKQTGGTESSGLSRYQNGLTPETLRTKIEAQQVAPTTTSFCRLCGAWRGSLGLEPTVQLYVRHIVQVFRAVWRVLRDDGTLWLNLGDSYAASMTSNHGRGKARPAANGRGEHQVPNGWENPPRVAPSGGLKPKDLIGVPWRVALALQDDGWYLRSEIIWSKPAPMPESVRDRPTRAHEHIFLLSKSPSYFYDADAVSQPVSQTHGARAWRRIFDPSKQTKESEMKQEGRKGGNDGRRDHDQAARNLRTVWEIGPEPCPDAHFATFPSEIPRRAILAGTSAAGCCAECGAPWERVTREVKSWRDWRPSCAYGDGPVPCVVLDPFLGSGRTGTTALELGRSFVGIDLSATYLETIARPAIEAALQAQVGEKEPPVLSVVHQGRLW